MSQPVTVLPTAMQRQLDGMLAAEAAAAAAPPVTTLPPAAPPPDPAPPAPSTPPAGESVTLTREAFNELQAQQARLGVAQDRLAEMQTRLTELETPAKGTPKPVETPAATTPRIRTDDVTFTDQENTEFASSREFITKVVRVAVAEAINPILQQLDTQLQTVQRDANTAATTAGNVQKHTFLDAVQRSVPDLHKFITHKHWRDFLDTEELNTGATYGNLLAAAVENTRLPQVVNIYKVFESKYITAGNNDGAGFAGAVPSGGAATIPTPAATAEKFKISDRKKASEDYQKGRILWDALQEINKKFDAADKLGNVDYSS